MSDTIEGRFWARVNKTTAGCWLWELGHTYSGYGRFSLHGKSVRAHRFAYELVKGPIPDGLEIDHLCRVRDCVNPSHLEAVTPRVNALRSTSFCAVNAAKTHCDNGHEFTKENTYVRPGSDGRWRACRACRRAHKIARMQRLAAS